MRTRVVITGLGAVTPLGSSPEALWEGLLAGRSGVGPITLFDTSAMKTHFAAEVKDFDGPALLGAKEVRRMDRYTQFSVAAARQAVQDAGLHISDANRDRVAVVIGSAIGGMSTLYKEMQVLFERGPSRVSPFLVPMMLPDSGAASVAIDLGARGPNYSPVTACATGTDSVGQAADLIRMGRADVVIGGAGESVVVPIALAGLNVMTALSTRNDEPQRASRPFDRTRDGFVMGEGSAVLVLESLEHAQGRGAHILAEVLGYGSTNDAYHISAPAENGAGAAISMQVALRDAGLGTGDIQYINAHGTSTPLNDKSETAAIKTVFGERAYTIPISSTKSMTGHLLGASGALEALICVKALGDQQIPPTINYEFPDPVCDLDYTPNTARSLPLEHVMSNSFGFGGHNATLVLGRWTGNGAAAGAG